jgi:non-heme chloroperoxidase
MTKYLVTSLVIVALFCPPVSKLRAADKKPWKDLTVQVGDIKIHYLEAGAGDRPMVLIPGWTMAAEVWKEQLTYFAARGFHVLAIDPRSHGATTKTDGGNTYQQQAADLHAFLKTLKIEQGILVGWSAGVAVILEYVSSPDTLRPEKLVLVDGEPTGFRQEGYPGGMSMQDAKSVLSRLEEDRAKFTDQMVRSMFTARQPELLYKELIEASMKTPTGTAAALFADLFIGDRRPAFARIGVPTLIVVTKERTRVGEYMQSKIARSKLEVLDETGHALFLEKPQTFNQLLESFLGN